MAHNNLTFQFPNGTTPGTPPQKDKIYAVTREPDNTELNDLRLVCRLLREANHHGESGDPYLASECQTEAYKIIAKYDGKAGHES